MSCLWLMCHKIVLLLAVLTTTLDLIEGLRVQLYPEESIKLREEPTFKRKEENMSNRNYVQKMHEYNLKHRRQKNDKDYKMDINHYYSTRHAMPLHDQDGVFRRLFKKSIDRRNRNNYKIGRRSSRLKDMQRRLNNYLKERQAGWRDERTVITTVGPLQLNVPLVADADSAFVDPDKGDCRYKQIESCAENAVSKANQMIQCEKEEQQTQPQQCQKQCGFEVHSKTEHPKEHGSQGIKTCINKGSQNSNNPTDLTHLKQKVNEMHQHEHNPHGQDAFKEPGSNKTCFNNLHPEVFKTSEMTKDKEISKDNCATTESDATCPKETTISPTTTSHHPSVLKLHEIPEEKSDYKIVAAVNSSVLGNLKLESLDNMMQHDLDHGEKVHHHNGPDIAKKLNYPVGEMVPVLEKLSQDLEEIKKEGIEAIFDSRDDFPCQINGLWTSPVAGVKILLDTCQDGKVKAKVVANNVPHSQGGFKDCDWHLTAIVPSKRHAPFALAAVCPDQNRIATFLGQCKTCKEADKIYGSWMFTRISRDCTDMVTAVDTKADVWFRDKVPEMREQKLARKFAEQMEPFNDIKEPACKECPKAKAQLFGKQFPSNVEDPQAEQTKNPNKSY